MPRRSLMSTLALVAVLSVPASSGCTVVKPLVNSVAYAPTQVMDRLDSTPKHEGDDLPTPVAVAAFVVLFPLNYAYWTVHGTIAGLFSGVVNDLNLVTGNGTMDRTLETMLEPMKTNAKPD
jgi:hypothetical protein